jgi:hypothetical protein
MAIKREKVVKMKANFHLQNKDKDVKNRDKIINLVHPDAAETPYGWAFENFYEAREHLKALSNKMGDTTTIGGKEFKPFDNLTMRWIKTSKSGQLLWVMCIDDDGERKFPMEAHKIYANKIERGSISEGIYEASQMEVVPKKITNDKLNDMNKCFGQYNDDCFNKTIFHEAIAVKDKRLESLI